MVELNFTSVLVVSDLHLRGPEDPNQQLFSSFLTERVAADPSCVLLIAGDLFDFWYAIDAQVPPHCQELFERLTELPSVHWLEGNHDIGQSRVLPRQGGLSIHARSLSFSCGSHSIHLCHGDRLDRADLGHRVLRTLMDSRAVHRLARGIGAARVQSIGAALSERARSGRGPMDPRDPRWLQAARADAAERQSRGVGLSVRGHGHYLGWWPEGLICLGDWLELHSYLELSANDSTPRLRCYRPGAAQDPVLCSRPRGEVREDGARRSA